MFSSNVAKTKILSGTTKAVLSTLFLTSVVGGYALTGTFSAPSLTDSEVTEVISTKKINSIENINLPYFISTMPAPPDENIDKARLYGVDVDSSGLRDDVQIYIAHKYPYKPDFRAANIQLAKVYESIIRNNNTSNLSVIAFLLHNEKEALKCFSKTIGKKDDLSELKKIVFNNEKRLKAYNDVAKQAPNIPKSYHFNDSQDICDSLIIGNEKALQTWKP